MICSCRNLIEEFKKAKGDFSIKNKEGISVMDVITGTSEKKELCHVSYKQRRVVPPYPLPLARSTVYLILLSCCFHIQSTAHQPAVVIALLKSLT